MAAFKWENDALPETPRGVVLGLERRHLSVTHFHRQRGQGTDPARRKNELLSCNQRIDQRALANRRGPEKANRQIIRHILVDGSNSRESLIEPWHLVWQMFREKRTNHFRVPAV